jgi:hypothetical protein
MKENGEENMCLIIMKIIMRKWKWKWKKWRNVAIMAWKHHNDAIMNNNVKNNNENNAKMSQ